MNDHSLPAPPDSEPIDSRRCQFFYSDGRQCRMPRWQKHPAFCLQHARTEEQLLGVDRAAQDLASLSGEFETASDVNHVLGKLFSLLAENRIPRGNAVALAYIAQLLLQSLPAVRHEVTDTLGMDAWDEILQTALDSQQPSS